MRQRLTLHACATYGDCSITTILLLRERLARVSREVDPLQLRYVVVGVDLRSTQRRVTQQLLNLAQVGTLIQEVRCEGVAQHVGRYLALHSTLPQKACHASLYIASRDTTSTL